MALAAHLAATSPSCAVGLARLVCVERCYVPAERAAATSTRTLPRPRRVKQFDSIRKPVQLSVGDQLLFDMHGADLAYTLLPHLRRPAPSTAPTTIGLVRKRRAEAVVTLEASKERFECAPLPHGKSRFVLRKLLAAGSPAHAKVVAPCPSV